MKLAMLNEAIKRYPTPFYLFDEEELHAHILHLRTLFSPRIQLCYAMKANSFILSQAARDVERIEVCSPGEARTCLELGIAEEKLVISGVYKDPEFIDELVREHPQILRYTAESIRQFDLLEAAACAAGHPISVLLRLTSGNQFGMSAQNLKQLALRCKESATITLAGVQYFSGTQKSSAKRLAREIARLARLIELLREECGVELAELEFGPGLPVSYYEEEKIAQAEQDQLASELNTLLSEMPFEGEIILELGRAIAASCGTYATSIVDTKSNKTGNYAIVDGGKHQFVYYSNAMSVRQPPCAIVPARTGAEPEPWNICGALCTTSDILVKKLDLVSPQVGDVICFERAGAYCMMEGISLFLSRDLPRVIMRSVDDEFTEARGCIESYSINMQSMS